MRMRQVAPCSAKIPHDDEDFRTDRATQEAGVDLIAGLIDGVLRARNPDTAQAWMARIPPACTPMQIAVDELASPPLA